MTLKEARALRDEIREAGIQCVVPVGHPHYFVELRTPKSWRRRFYTRQAWLEYRDTLAKETA